MNHCHQNQKCIATNAILVIIESQSLDILLVARSIYKTIKENNRYSNTFYLQSCQDIIICNLSKNLQIYKMTQ